MIYVIGKLSDTAQYIGREGYAVLARRDDYTPELSDQFVDEALAHGDGILILSLRNVSGQYRREVIRILERLQA